MAKHPDLEAVQKHLARLAGLVRVCDHADRKIGEATQAIHGHHRRRAKEIRNHLLPPGVDRGLEDEYLESLREQEYTSRLN